MSSVQDVQPYTAWNPPMGLGGELSGVQVEKIPHQISSSSFFSVPITFLEWAIKALEDTAAVVTIIFDGGNEP